MTSERLKRRDFFALVFISKSISTKLLIKLLIIIIKIHFSANISKIILKRHNLTAKYIQKTDKAIT